VILTKLKFSKIALIFSFISVAFNGCKLNEEHPIAAIYYSNLAYRYCMSDNYPKAIEYYNKALKIDTINYGRNSDKLAPTYHNLAMIYYIKAEYDKALDLFLKNIEIRELHYLKDQILLAYAYNNIAVIYHELGNFDKSVNYHEKALYYIKDKLGNRHSNLVPIYENLASVYYDVGNFTKSLELYKNALQIRKKKLGHRHAELIISYNKIATVYEALKKDVEANSFINKALKLLTKSKTLTLNRPSGKFSFTVYKSKTRKNVSKIEEKIPLLNIDYQLSKNTLNNLGAAFSKKSYFEAIENLKDKKTEFIYESGEIKIIPSKKSLDGRHPYSANFYGNLSNIYARSGNYSDALELLLQSKKIWSRIVRESHPIHSKINYNIALLYESLNEIEASSKVWKKIIKSVTNQINEFYIFLPDDQRLDYLNTLTQIQSEFYAFTANYGDEELRTIASNFQINTKSLILDYSVSISNFIEEMKDEELINLFNNFRLINQSIVATETMTSKEIKKRGIDVKGMINDRDNLYKQIVNYEKLEAKLLNSKVDWKEIQRKLLPNEIAIDYIKFFNRKFKSYQYYATVIKKDFQNPLFLKIKSEDELKSLFTKTNDFAGRPTYLKYSEARMELYHKLWQPLNQYLTDVNSIHVSTAGFLHQVDFETLQNDAKQYLAEKYEFHYYTALRDIVKQDKKQKTYKDAVLLGHILYNLSNRENYENQENELIVRNEIIPLPATLNEVKAIGDICKKSNLSTTLLTIDAASEDTIYHFTGNIAPSIYHIATHGVILESSEISDIDNKDTISLKDRLCLSKNSLQHSLLMLYKAGESWSENNFYNSSRNDGILTALEVTNLDLSNTELVVLSACNSGIGSQHTTEGVFGLPRAFKLAGVDKILVSLWPVEDETTKELMIQFYTNLLEKKQDAATALRNAKGEMRKRNAAPKKWAGFVLVE